MSALTNPEFQYYKYGKTSLLLVIYRHELVVIVATDLGPYCSGLITYDISLDEWIFIVLDNPALILLMNDYSLSCTIQLHFYWWMIIYCLRSYNTISPGLSLSLLTWSFLLPTMQLHNASMCIVTYELWIITLIQPHNIPVCIETKELWIFVLIQLHNVTVFIDTNKLWILTLIQLRRHHFQQDYCLHL